jgi:uncharacterized protein (TIGR03435 family)
MPKSLMAVVAITAALAAAQTPDKAPAFEAQGPPDAAPNSRGTHPSSRDSAAMTCACSFEVASIKPAAPNQPGMGMQRLPGGRVNMKNVTLRLMIVMAWDIRDFQVSGGPAWIDTDRFDILAKPESELPDTSQGSALLRRMIQTLAADRFGLVYHREQRQMPVYALIVGKNGPKLRVSATPGEQTTMMGGRGKLEGKNAKPADLARLLSGTLGRTVLDQTDLADSYDFNLEWAPDVGEGPGFKGARKDSLPEAPQAADGPSIFTAIQEQLGLKLESRKGPVEILVVDRAEKPSER